MGFLRKNSSNCTTRSDKIIDLEGFIIADAGNEILLPSYLMFPDQYLIVYQNGPNAYGPFGDTLALPGFISLGNTSDQIRLLDSQDQPIHFVSYEDSWYQDSNKKEGGWTLELINPNRLCAESDNWLASLDPNGGTPGKVNSLLETTPDNQGPVLERAFPVGNNGVRLFFDERLDPASAENLDSYNINGLNIINAALELPFQKTVVLTFDTPLSPGEVYQLDIELSLADCHRNAVEQVLSARFGLPEVTEPQDIILNEILFNPATGGVRFVELFNRSAKVLNIADLALSNRNLEGEIDDLEPVNEDYLLFPEEYVVVTPDPSDIKNRYFVMHPDAMVDNELPVYGDRLGAVVLIRPDPNGAQIIDELVYTNDFHNALIDDENGVSIERLDPDAPTQSEANWHSAAQKVGFATPTYKNSQNRVAVAGSSQVFSLEHETLSPDGDGFEDFLTINYQTEQPGFIANIKIFDARGRQVKTLVQNELLASEGFYKWDGDTDEAKKPELAYI